MASLEDMEGRLRTARMGHSYSARQFLLSDTAQILSELKLWRDRARELRAARAPTSMPLEFGVALAELFSHLEAIEKLELRDAGDARPVSG